ncbi:MAG: hypothetical protein ACLQUY_24835 [Ktedonobacterales bacterium]
MSRLDEPAVAPAEPHAAALVQILAAYAAGIQAIINRDGLQPFRFAALAMDEALDEVDQSLATLEINYVGNLW